MRHIPILLILAFAIALPIFGQSNAEPINATLIQLIANPDKFDGKRIRVTGFMNLEFEGDALHISKEDYERSLGNCVWLDIEESLRSLSGKLSQQYVIIEGVYDAKQLGHMGLFQGTIKSISRCDYWPTLKESR